MSRKTYIEIAENAHLGGRYRSIALSHLSALGPVHKLLLYKLPLVYVVGVHPSPGSSDLIEEVG
jgi:hypothetical protein